MMAVIGLWRFPGCPSLRGALRESRAGQYKYSDIQNAAAHLHGMLEAVKT
jgi:hypothetical protein